MLPPLAVSGRRLLMKAACVSACGGATLLFPVPFGCLSASCCPLHLRLPPYWPQGTPPVTLHRPCCLAAAGLHCAGARMGACFVC